MLVSVSLAVDNRENLLTITTLQIQANQEGRYIAGIADLYLANPLFALLNETLAADCNICLWQLRECQEIVLFLTHHIEVV